MSNSTSHGENTAARANPAVIPHVEFRPIEIASWPNSCAHPEAQFVVSVIVGIDHLYWGIHSGSNGQFALILSFRTTHFEKIYQKSTSVEISQQDIFKGYWSPEACRMMGGPEFEKDKNLTNLRGFLSQKRVPYWQVYAISNSSQESAYLQRMFEYIPCRIHQLRASDFFDNIKRPLERQFETLGVEHCSGLYAAKLMYGSPVLVVDAGVAITTWIGTNGKGDIQGCGGATLGFGAKFTALNDCTGALPLIHHSDLEQLLADCRKTKQPLSDCAGTDTRDAMLVGVLRETAGALSHVIQTWVKQIKKERRGSQQQQLTVVVTGAEAVVVKKLLHPLFSYILQPNEEHQKTMNQVKVETFEDLATYGIGHLLQSRSISLSAMSKVETIRHELLGSRVVQPLFTSTTDPERHLRGTVFDIARDSGTSMINDIFKVMYDDGSTADMTPVRLFDCLMNYAVNGEMKRVLAMRQDSTEAQEKQKQRAKQYAIEMGRLVPDCSSRVQKYVVRDSGNTNSSEKNKRSRALIEDEDSVGVVKAPRVGGQREPHTTPNRSDSKKDGGLDLPPSSSRKGSVSNERKRPIDIEDLHASPKRYVKWRVAKRFDDEMYYGTVEKYLPPEEDDDEDLWHILYDDGDTEDLNAKEMIRHIKKFQKITAQKKQGHGVA